MLKTINWGIIGLGKIAHKFASDLKLYKGAELYGVASRDYNKAKMFSEKFHSIKYFDSYENLAKDPNIDIVYIATPNSLHFENTMMCLRNGKSVLCEKPMGLDSKEVQIMIDEAKSRKLFLMEAIWTRFLPSTEKVLEILKSKIIGKVNFVRADFGFKGDPNPEGRILNKSLGGGSLLDIGIYPIYLSLLTIGVPKFIKAMARITSTNVDGYCSMLFDYDGDEKAILESTIEASTPTEAYIYCSKGYIKLHSNFHHATKISLFEDSSHETSYDIKYIGNGYYHEIEEVTTCIINSKIESNKVPHSTSIDLIKTIDKVKKEIGLDYNDK